MKYLLVEDRSLEALMFKEQAWIFWFYAFSTCCALLSGPDALFSSINLPKQHPNQLFCLSCLFSAWSGAFLSYKIGPNGLGGTSLQFYWWGLGAVWTFLIGGIYVFASQARWLAARDWTIYAYALAWLPAIVFLTYPIWQAGMEMTRDEAIVTAAFMPFAGLFVLAHWLISDVIDDAS